MDKLKVHVLEGKLKAETATPRFCVVDLMDATPPAERRRTGFQEPGGDMKLPKWPRNEKKAAFKYELPAGKGLPEFFRVECRSEKTECMNSCVEMEP
eukprot:SAG22_NODE_2007_length_3152_cov_3.209630_1_plen_96_part_10